MQCYKTDEKTLYFDFFPLFPPQAHAGEFFESTGDARFDRVYSCEAVHHFGGEGHRGLPSVLGAVGRGMGAGGRLVVQKVGDGGVDDGEEEGGPEWNGVLPSVRVKNNKVGTAKFVITSHFAILHPPPLKLPHVGFLLPSAQMQ